MTTDSTQVDPPVAREEPSQKLAATSFYLAVVGCAGLTVVVSVVMAAVVILRVAVELLLPQPGQWRRRADRMVTCLVRDPSGSVSSTLAGSRR